MEKLAALCCLWAFGLGTKEDYYTELDRLFLLSPEDDFLLELEDLGGDCAAAWRRIASTAQTEMDIDKLGKELFAALEKVYNENKFALKEFGARCYKMWNLFPAGFRNDDPFFVLCYADDPLSWGDEKQTREIYQKAFDYYKEKP